MHRSTSYTSVGVILLFPFPELEKIGAYPRLGIMIGVKSNGGIAAYFSAIRADHLLG